MGASLYNKAGHEIGDKSVLQAGTLNGRSSMLSRERNPDFSAAQSSGMFNPHPKNSRLSSNFAELASGIMGLGYMLLTDR
jgi:hypothetical protein